MSILKKENRMVLVTFIICMLIVGFTINYTYSFFAVEKVNDSVITGEVESMKLNVNVTRVVPTTDSKLVPQLDAYITYAVTGRTGNCLDDNGNTVCHVYKVTLENQGSSSANVSGTLALDNKSNTNLKWARITGLTSPTLINDVKTPAESDFVTSDELLAGTTKDYYILVWISETGSSQTDSNNYTGVVTFTTIDGNMAGSTNIANSYTQIDNSGANAPAYVENLIPVMYDTNTNNWVVADTTSSTSTYGWYDYDAKKWANAVLLNDTRREELNTNYKNSDGNYIPGTPIGDKETDGVLAFYVWIPRYKYKVWNINKVPGTDTYNAYTTGIDIEFENGTDTTGTIICSYMYTAPSSLAGSPNEICSDVSGGTGYYTHPAFKFGNDNVTGLWIGKFEISSTDQTTSNYGGGTTIGLAPRILPNVISWRYNNVGNFWKVIKDMQVENNIYGLSTDTTETDAHLLTNMEWGAVAYLMNSEYGRCANNACTEVSINNSGEDTYYTTYTGRSSGAPGSTTTIVESDGTYEYNEIGGQLASTTGNIYGVYDMSGGASEYVMGNMSSTYGNYIYFAKDAGTNYIYEGFEKYVTTYAYGTTYNNQTAYNRGRLGDATSEAMLFTSSVGGWYGDFAGILMLDYSWYRRGGFFSEGVGVGLFNFCTSYGGYVNNNYSTRAALIGF